MSKEIFTDHYKNFIQRDGADRLLAWLEQSDFFTAPASTKYHLAQEGGLCQHSVNVFNNLCRLNDVYAVTENRETLAIVALLHDLCKVGFYKTDFRNTKDENGNWQKVPYYAIDDQLPYGHGEKSVYITSGFVRLSREESMAIRWHMGSYDDSVKGGSYALTGAFKKYPLALLLHMADMAATYFDEGEN